MTKIISTINLKGGVGKTQMTVALAEFLAKEHDERVLLIDLDPQTNATVSLMDETAWLRKDQNGETLLQLFKDKLEKTSRFNINKAIVKRASNVGGGIRNLDLLPSSLGLIEIQDSLPLIPAGRFYVTSPVTILKEAISAILDDYNFVLIDFQHMVFPKFLVELKTLSRRRKLTYRHWVLLFRCIGHKAGSMILSFKI